MPAPQGQLCRVGCHLPAPVPGGGPAALNVLEVSTQGFWPMRGQTGGYSRKGPLWAEILGPLMASATASASFGTERLLVKTDASDMGADRISQQGDFRQGTDRC